MCKKILEHAHVNTRYKRDDLPEHCDIACEGNSERRACLKLKAQCAFNASEVAFVPTNEGSVIYSVSHCEFRKRANKQAFPNFVYQHAL